ncbi:SURF1 domain containing protein [Trichuris trichiura]|uniref:SURF1-like protein n=1 Tax=Trichuris trichiura TaxID=36087 RepID=A0A077ZLG7_TRITR|nr:SURF1 domain containing protein [Trichuris trichiura]
MRFLVNLDPSSGSFVKCSVGHSGSAQSRTLEGEVEVIGVNRLNEKRPPFVMKNDPVRNMWFYRDVNAMAALHNTAPVYLEADAVSTVDGGPLGGQTNVQIPDNHTAYIVTW